MFVHHCLDEDGLETFHVFRRSLTDEDLFYRQGVYNRNISKCNLDECHGNSCPDFNFNTLFFNDGISCKYCDHELNERSPRFCSNSCLQKHLAGCQNDWTASDPDRSLKRSK